MHLDTIAATLEGLEETIISKLIDRAQFRVNTPAYEPGRSGFSNERDRSLFDLRLRLTEEMDAQFGRFCVPEERPFTPHLAPPRRTVHIPPTGLHIDSFDTISVAAAILSAYRSLLPRLCAEGDDGHYGSSVEHDVFALQALSRRIHYGGLYVAESKYREQQKAYRELIDAGDHAAIERALTRTEVEERIYERVRDKISHAQQRVNRNVRTCIDPEILVAFYREYVIPLTKRSEVLYLLNRNHQTSGAVAER